MSLRLVKAGSAQAWKVALFPCALVLAGLLEVCPKPQSGRGSEYLCVSAACALRPELRMQKGGGGVAVSIFSSLSVSIKQIGHDIIAGCSGNAVCVQAERMEL